MNYEQKYKDALERAKDMLAYKEVRQENMEYLFPELKESEDDRMKKAIMHVLRENYTDAAVIEGVEIAEIVTWLKKQCEQIELKEVAQDNRPIIVMADFNGGEGFYKLNLDNLNKEQVDAIEIMINNPKQGKKLDADKVIEWINEHVPTKFEDMQNYVNQFKRDFGL